jgi:hypothetical protein
MMEKKLSPRKKKKCTREKRPGKNKIVRWGIKKQEKKEVQETNKMMLTK